jgi:uncharacterized membrane protein required for colicin V production
MSTIDAAFGVLLLVFAALGAWKGALRQFVGALAIIAALLAPSLFAASSARQLQARLDLPFPLTFVLCATSLAIASYVGVRLFWLLPLRLVEARRDDGAPTALGTANRLAGAALGATKFSLYVWLALSLLSMLAPRIQTPDQAARLEASRAYRLARDHNALGFLLREELALLDRVVNEVGSGSGRAGPAVAALARNAHLQAVARDESLRTAVAEGDLATIVRSPDVLAFVLDRVAMEQLEAALAEIVSMPEAGDQQPGRP